jgi:hypothetical protein
MAETPKKIIDIESFGNDVKAMMKKIVIDSLSTETLTKTFMTLDVIAQGTMKSIGAGAESAERIKKGIVDSMDGIQKLGYEVDDALRMSAKLTTDLSNITGRNMTYNSELFGKLTGAAMVVGLEADDLSKRFIDAGFSLEAVSEKTGKAIDVARASGLNGQKVSQEMVKNLDAMDKFTFQGGIDGLTKMAALSVQMRVGMEKTLALAERLLSPEAAIETAAALQRLGVVQSDLLDPMRLMNLSQNDPAELQKQIVEMTKGFTKLNAAGQMEILPGGRERLQAIGKELNIPYEQLTNMARSGAELESKLKGIKFPEMATEEQKTLISNLAHLNKDNEYVISVGGVDKNLDEYMAKLSEGGDVNDEMLKELEESNKPKSIEEIAKSQLDISTKILGALGGVGAKAVLGKATASATVDAANMAVAFYTSVGKVMDKLGGTIEDKRIQMNNVSKEMVMTEEERGNLGTTLPILLNPFNVPKAIKQVDEEKEGLPQSLKAVFDTVEESLKGFSTAVKAASGAAADMIGLEIQEANDFIRTEDGNVSFFEKDTIIAGTGLNDIAKMIKGDISSPSKIKETSPSTNELLENTTKNPVTNGSSNENKLVIEVRVSTSNDNINPELNQKIVDVVTQAFKDDMGLKQVVATSIKDVVTNGSRPS